MKLFQSKHYPALMFLLILSALIIILFSMINVFEKSADKIPVQKNSPISGLVTLKVDSQSMVHAPETKEISLRKYILYDVLIGFLFLLLYLLIKFIYRR